VNDIAAAKAYLDRQNDQKELNSSSIVLIGAGEGATLGAMWAANECRRRKDKSMFLGAAPMLGDPESRDIAACVWLTISPRVGTANVGTQLRSWVSEAGRRNKIPMAFIFGKNDSKGDEMGRGLQKVIKGTSKGKEFQFTGAQAIPDTKLAGHALLQRSLDTENWIMREYLDKVMEARGVKERVERKVAESRYYYTQPAPKNTIPLKINKQPSEEVPSVDVKMLLGS